MRRSNVLSAVWRSLQSGVQSSRSAKLRRGLSLETLEPRWAPAVDLSGEGSEMVTIEDSSTGRTSNTIEIIDDFTTVGTFIRINGGEEQQVSAAKQFANLTINMGTGNDKVIFTTRGTDVAASGLSVARTIDLGDGNDSLSIDLGSSTSLGNGAYVYIVAGENRGNDTYAVKGNIVSGSFSLKSADGAGDAQGNDKYNFDFTGTAISKFSVDLTDLAGNDRYTAKVSVSADADDNEFALRDAAGNDRYDLKFTSTYGSALSATIADGAGRDDYKIAAGDNQYGTMTVAVDDDGASRNAVRYTRGNLTSAQETIALHFEGATSLSVLGETTIDSLSNRRIEFVGGEGNDKISYRDEAVIGKSISTLHAITNGGNDKITAVYDGLNDKTQVTLGAFSQSNLHFDLGDGNDSVSVVFHGSTWISNSGGVGNFLTIAGDMGAGNDRFSSRVSRGSLNLTGPSANLVFNVSLGSGDDRFSVDLGKFTGTAGRFTVIVNAGAGRDRLTLAGRNADANDDSFSAQFELGDDEVVDRVTSKLRIGAPEYVSQQTFEIYGAVEGVDRLSLAVGALAPTWTF